MDGGQQDDRTDTTRNRIPVSLWCEVRAYLLARDEDASNLLAWSSGTRVPAEAEISAGEVIWAILCAGKTAQAARKIETKVRNALDEGRPVVEAFGYRAKAAAIEALWQARQMFHDDLLNALATAQEDVAAGAGVEGWFSLLDWLQKQAFIGPVTRYQLAKNVGADLCKPDIWLCRLSGIADKARVSSARRFSECMTLCRRLAEASGDNVASVDSLLWLACNKGVLAVSKEAGPISFHPEAAGRRGSIYDGGQGR